MKKIEINVGDIFETCFRKVPVRYEVLEIRDSGDSDFVYYKNLNTGKENHGVLYAFLQKTRKVKINN
jgi:hypothetical protein